MSKIKNDRNNNSVLVIRFFRNKRNKNTSKGNDLQIVIKGLSYKIAKENLEELKAKGIKSINQFSKNEDYNITKAEVENKELLEKISSEGLFIGYKRLRIEKYVQPISIIQCFNCQKFGYYASNCKATDLICVKCSGQHKVKECKESTIKCANCGNEHTSSYGGCPFKQAQIKDKTDKINSKATSVLRSYSSILNQNKASNLEEVLKKIDEKIDIIYTSIKDRFDEIENKLSKSINDKINKTIEAKTDEIMKQAEEKINSALNSSEKSKEKSIATKMNILKTDVMKEINKGLELEDLKQQQVFYLIDIFRLFWPDSKLTTQQIQHIMEAASRNFTLKLDITELKKYIDSIHVK